MVLLEHQACSHEIGPPGSSMYIRQCSLMALIAEAILFPLVPLKLAYCVLGERRQGGVQQTRGRRPHGVRLRSELKDAWEQASASGRSLQQSDSNLTSVEIYVSVNSTLKHQRCRSLCFWKFAGFHPICKIEVHLWPESFLSIRKYASYDGLPLLRRVVGQYLELETLPYLDFRLHLNSLYGLGF